MKKLGFYIGHVNYLPHATLLYKSILENTQLSEECQIYAVTPENLNLTAALMGVHQLKVSIEPGYRAIPYVDKMFAAAAFENICDDEYIWMDVDSYFFKNLEYRKSTEIYANPVDEKNIGDIFGEERSDLWRTLFIHFNLSDIYPFLTTRVTKEKIYPYYNASMVLVNNNKELFQKVKYSIYELMNNESIKRIITSSELHRKYIHQAIFTCAILKLYNKSIKPLPYGANYSLSFHEKTPTPIPYGDVISIKYHNAFEKNGVPNIWKEIFEPVKNNIKETWYY
ncbi:MAG TPA: hypothetical protein VN258_01865 [Mobilitalea sp.]|nr:hypothetical protein [Mobilitalea sp.]